MDEIGGFSSSIGEIFTSSVSECQFAVATHAIVNTVISLSVDVSQFLGHELTASRTSPLERPRPRPELNHSRCRAL